MLPDSVYSYFMQVFFRGITHKPTTNLCIQNTLCIQTDQDIVQYPDIWTERLVVNSPT